jgi:hypothetical protein
MPRTISRRSLFGTAISGVVACLGGHLSFLAARAGFTYSTAGYSELAALCSGLGCPRAIGKSCLLVLPARESTRSSLARIILADVRPQGENRSPPDLLAQAIRERGRADFREGRVVSVDGWILSLTETRIYALAALLPEPRVPAA